jgi:molybdate transport system regulatory protein
MKEPDIQCPGIHPCLDNMLVLAYRVTNFFFGRFSMEIKAKFWIENKGEVVLGGGKTALLLAVDRFGSIQRAADEFGMSYRHAWGAIKKIEQRAGFKIVDTKLGGRDGGGARLTPKEKAFVGRVDSLLSDLHKVMEKRFKQNAGKYSF